MARTKVSAMAKAMAKAMERLLPRSLKGQLLFAIALALLLAQAISAVALYRAQTELREAAMLHTAAFRLLSADRPEWRPRLDRRRLRPDIAHSARRARVEEAAASPLRADERRDRHAAAKLLHILNDQDYPAARVELALRPIALDPPSAQRIERRETRFGQDDDEIEKVMVAGVERRDGSWRVVRVLVPPGERGLVMTLIGQTLLIYGIIVGALALILRRITRPLAALTGRLERFADTREAGSPMEPEGPSDVRSLISAHNVMEGRIAALLDEKDVMLGAIGHDLKTPLAALRVRIESVEDDHERGRMAATIEDIARTLDDILSLARVGRPRGGTEPTELSALVASVVEEYEDMGEPVELDETCRIVLPLRSTWLRRAIRNLIGNALRYGGKARVSLRREGGQAVIRIDDEGPGIAEAEMARMQEPFTRGEPSRNSETGGAGLGLTLARAIAEQHGGTLVLTNRRESGSAVSGLSAEIRLPLT